jgi:hypothetical protein
MKFNQDNLHIIQTNKNTQDKRMTSSERINRLSAIVKLHITSLLFYYVFFPLAPTLEHRADLSVS